jgi:hypothetical protein
MVVIAQIFQTGLKHLLKISLLFKTWIKTLLGFSFIKTKQQEESYAIHLVV